MLVWFEHDRFLLRRQNVLVVDAFFETAFQNVLIGGPLVEGKTLVAVWAHRAELLILDGVLQWNFMMKLYGV